MILSATQRTQAITLYSEGISLPLIAILMQVTENQLSRDISKYITA